MPNYIYKVRNVDGRVFLGVLEADDMRALRKKLRNSGYYVVALAPQTERRRILSLFEEGITLDTLTLFTRQLASMLEAGMSIISALETIWKSLSNHRMQLVISQMKNQMASGGSLSKSVNEFPQVFPAIYRALMSVAETGAGLVPILKKLVEYLENQRAFIDRIKRATLYPVTVVVFAVLVLVLMLTLVVPTFEKVFAKINVPLPFLTRVIIHISAAMRSVAFWIILPGIIGALFFAYKRMKAVPQGALLLDRLKLKLPIFGKIYYLASVERFTRSLGLLLGGGLPIIASIDVAKGTTNNRELENALQLVEKKVVAGVALSEAFRETKLFPVLMIEMINLGEHTGTLTEMLERTADNLSNELDMRIHKFLTLLEPMLIIFVGGLVAFILFVIYMPIFSLWQSLPGMR